MSVTGQISSFTNTRIPSGSGFSQVGKLFLQRMLSNPNYKTTINIPGKGTVIGFCEGPFAFQGKADWKELVDLGAVSDQFNSAAAGFQALKSIQGGSVSDADLAQMNFKSVRASELRWNGSECPVFSLKLILPSYNSNATQSPIDSVKMLCSCVFPEYKDGGNFLVAPLGYGIRGGSSQQYDRPSGGTISVRRGRYFYAPNQVMRSVSATFSQEVMEDGYPLYVEANLEFMPWRTPDWKEISSWFKVR